MRRLQIHSLLSLLTLSLLTAGCSAPQDTGETVDPGADRAELHSLLDEFLANADVASAHERFWADDLVYTSSDGTRTDKASILAGMDAPVDGAERGPAYSAADVDIRLYGTTAVVAFRLVIAPPQGSDEPVRSNLNTGTFLKRDGVWKVVAWQSTRVPE